MKTFWKILWLLFMGGFIGWVIYKLWPKDDEKKDEGQPKRGYVDMPNYDKDQTWYEDDEVTCNDL